MNIKNSRNVLTAICKSALLTILHWNEILLNKIVKQIWLSKSFNQKKRLPNLERMYWISSQLHAKKN